MTRVLGVDGGNSKTIALLTDETGRVLGMGRSRGANHQSSNIENAMVQIKLAVAAALDGAGITSDQVDFVYYALAGADLPIDFTNLNPVLAAARLGKAYALNNDMMAALRSGTENPDAVVVVLGAGTNAAGRNAAGMEIRLPGLGWHSGDWGGGGELARAAISLTVRAHDGRGQPTLLHDMILQALDLPDADALVEQLYLRKITQDRIYDLAPLVFKASDQGDIPARDLVTRSGIEVATTAIALMRRLDILDADADLVLGGSLFRSENSLLLGTIADRVGQAAPDVRIVVPEIEPAAGAVLCALDQLGIPAGESVRRRLTETPLHRELSI